jgi:hypothetical protein
MKRDDIGKRGFEFLASLGVLMVQLGRILIPEASNFANGQTFLESQAQQLDPPHGSRAGSCCSLCLQVSGLAHDRASPRAVEHV